VRVAVDLQVDETGALNPGVSFIEPLSDGQSRALDLGATLSSQGAREDKFGNYGLSDYRVEPPVRRARFTDMSDVGLLVPRGQAINPGRRRRQSLGTTSPVIPDRDPGSASYLLRAPPQCNLQQIVSDGAMAIPEEEKLTVDEFLEAITGHDGRSELVRGVAYAMAVPKRGTTSSAATFRRPSSLRESGRDVAPRRATRPCRPGRIPSDIRMSWSIVAHPTRRH
jgi:hypothetical protein